MYRTVLRAMITRAITDVLEENDFIIKDITELCVREDTLDCRPSLHFEYETFAWDMSDGTQVTISGCGYVSVTGVHAVEGAWSVTEGWV